MNQEFFADIFIWISNLIFFLSLVPQIFLNKKIQTTSGLSDLFLLGNMNSVIANLGYTFSVDLPLVYKIMNPIYALAVFALVFQRFRYSDFEFNKKVFLLFGINLIFILSFVVLTVLSVPVLGWFLGWVPIGISLCKKVPQIFKIHRTKSVHGFSLGFILLSLGAYLFEIIGVLALNLPTQVLYQDLKGISVYVIFLVQFVLYKKNSQIEGLPENA
jgi:hypothetical protein